MVSMLHITVIGIQMLLLYSKSTLSNKCWGVTLCNRLFKKKNYKHKIEIICLI